MGELFREPDGARCPHESMARARVFLNPEDDISVEEQYGVHRNFTEMVGSGPDGLGYPEDIKSLQNKLLAYEERLRQCEALLGNRPYPHGRGCCGDGA